MEAKAVKSKNWNYLLFDNMKEEMIFFTRGRKPKLKKKIHEAHNIVKNSTIGFKTEAMR